MKPLIAVQTLTAIHNTMMADQGNSYRGNLGRVIPHIGDAYREDEDGFRNHMGASIIGGECARKIVYDYRWATVVKHSGQTLRLFNRGHLEEARFIAILLSIGVEVYQQDSNGKQFRISHANGHYGGSGDGVGVKIPDLRIDQAALLEFKTHGEKSFIELAGKDWRKYHDNLIGFKRDPKVQFNGKGVREAKFEHYVQMQQYMRKFGLAAALYGAVNKNTDDLYLELVPLDPENADQFLDRGEKLVFTKTLPKKLSESPGFFKCINCDHKPVCHSGIAPNVSCRSCEFGSPSDDPARPGVWLCGRHFNQPIPDNVMRTGCQDYKLSSMF